MLTDTGVVTTPLVSLTGNGIGDGPHVHAHRVWYYSVVMFPQKSCIGILIPRTYNVLNETIKLKMRPSSRL